MTAVGASRVKEAEYGLLYVKKKDTTKLKYLHRAVIRIVVIKSLMIIQTLLLIFFQACFAQCRHLVLFVYA